MAKKTLNKKRVGVRQVLLGSVLVNSEVTRWLPMAGLFAFFGVLMISNRFKGEKVLRKTVVLQEEVKELRSESATIGAELMNMSRYSEMLKLVDRKGLGLKQSKIPPVKIKVEEL